MGNAVVTRATTFTDSITEIPLPYAYTPIGIVGAVIEPDRLPDSRVMRSESKICHRRNVGNGNFLAHGIPCSVVVINSQGGGINGIIPVGTVFVRCNRRIRITSVSKVPCIVCYVAVGVIG